jgi:nucleotidyltransferase/DNA polymerase involved in DNA repair
MVQLKEATNEQTEVEISELWKVKGFWEATIAKLREKGIATIKDLKSQMDNKTARDFQDTLTPIQFKQAQNYFIEHPYDIL